MKLILCFLLALPLALVHSDSCESSLFAEQEAAAVKRNQDHLDAIKKLSGSATDPIAIQVASRPNFYVGAFYNHATASVVSPGFSIFDDAQQKDVNTAPAQGGNTFSFSNSYTYHQRLQGIEVTGALDLDLKAFQLTGSAEFAMDKTHNDFVARAALIYNGYTQHQVISTDNMNNPKNLNLLTQKAFSDATHVITAVTLGTSATFDFSKQTSNSSDKLTVAGSLCINIGKIGIKLQGKGNVSHTDTNVTSQFSCKYSGDLLLDNIPETLAQMVNASTEVVSKSADPANSIVMKAYLTPVTNWKGGLNQVTNSMEANVIGQMTARMAKYDSLQTTAGNQQQMLAVNLFQQLPIMINDFKSGANIESLTFDSSVLTLIPQFRNGTLPLSQFAKQVADMLAQSGTSLTMDNLNNYITYRNTEANLMQVPLSSGLFMTDAEFTRQLIESDFVFAMKTNVFCGDDAFLSCLKTGCSTMGLSPTSWSNDPTFTTALDNRYINMKKMESWNAGTLPLPSQKVAFAIHEETCVGMTPSVTLELYAEDTVVLPDFSFLAGGVYPRPQQASDCPTLIVWDSDTGVKPSNVILTYRVSQRIQGKTVWTNSTVISTSVRPINGSQSLEVIVQPICNFVTGKGEPLQLFCGPSSGIQPIYISSFAAHDVPCIAGNCATLPVDFKAATKTYATSCKEWRQRGHIKSGMYKVYDGLHDGAVEVYCHMEESDSTGGWTVIQRVVDHTSFMRSWEDYRSGFPAGGNLVNGSFWIGNSYLYAQTANTPMQLRIDMTKCDGTPGTIVYQNFKLDCEFNKYVLHVGPSSTNGGLPGAADAGDAFNQGGASSQNGAMFSTLDKDNDGAANSCAQIDYGAWWYSSCGPSHGNGPYTYPNCHTASTYGMQWQTFQPNDGKPLATFTMMIKAM